MKLLDNFKSLRITLPKLILIIKNILPVIQNLEPHQWSVQLA